MRLTSLLEIPAASAFDQVVDLASAPAMHPRVHRLRVEGPVDAAAPLQQAGEERGLAEFAMPSSTSAAGAANKRGRCPLRCAMRVSVRSWRTAPDERGRLGLDQLLQDPVPRLERILVGHVAGLDRSQQLGQFLIGEGHRWVRLCALVRNTSKITPVTHTLVEPSSYRLPTPRHGTRPCRRR